MATLSFQEIISQGQKAAGAVKAKINNITAQSKGLDSYAVFQLVGSMGSNLQDQINNTRQLISSLASASSSSSSGGAATTVQNFTLTTANTTISVASPSIIGSFLTIFIIQDATGGRLITWDTNFRFTTTNIDTTASTTSVFSFVSNIDPLVGAVQWFMLCTPITGAL